MLVHNNEGEKKLYSLKYASKSSDPPYPGVTLTHGPDGSCAHQQHSHSTERGKHMWLLYGHHEQTQRHQRHPQNNEPISVWLVLCHGFWRLGGPAVDNGGKLLCERCRF